MRWWFSNRSADRIRRALKAMRNGDFSSHVSTEHLHGSEKELAEEMNEAITDFRRQIIHLERKYDRYQTMLDTIDAALITADADGKVLWMNKQAMQRLCGFRIADIDMLSAVHPDLPDSLRKLSPGRTKLSTMNINGHEAQLKLTMSKYSVEGEETYLYSIENVNQLIQQSEIEAQRKLVSVLTHEIMNSLSPIISLSATICDSDAEQDPDVRLAIKTINRRSRGLLTFVENYRKLSRLSEPKPEWTRIGDIFDGLRTLYCQPFIAYSVEEPDLQLRIDRHQIEQVLINLVKNALEACESYSSPAISVTSKADRPGHRFLLSVSDNGPGISLDAVDNIFVPFFTTKAGGSGIGLSLSRQIINMHGGTIKVDTSAQGSCFTIVLPLVYRL